MSRDGSELNRFERARRASSKDTPRRELLAYKTDSSEAVRASLFGNSAFKKQAEEFARHELENPQNGWVTRQAIAGSPWVSAETLRLVASHGEWFVWIALANKERCPTDLLETFAADTRENYKEIAKIARRRLSNGRPL